MTEDEMELAERCHTDSCDHIPDLSALRAWARDPKPSPNVPGCDCRNPDETWDEVDEDDEPLLCLLHDRRWGAVQRDTAVAVILDLEAALYEVRRLIGRLGP